MFHEYEIVFIIRPDLDDADTNTAIEKVEAVVAETGGHLLERDDWGKRKLAYMIKKHTKGHYVLLRVVSEPSAILEIERRMRLDDRVIRFLTVKIAEAVDVEWRVQQAREENERKAEEAARKAEEAAAAAAESDDDNQTADAANAD